METTSPRCGNAMIKRTAKRGENAGKMFLGCTTYPACKGTREL
ncbi:MAG: topoisomerase DNA-binding C4 zinc finger domain-containing protein [Pseudomonadota bacterium]